MMNGRSKSSHHAELGDRKQELIAFAALLKSEYANLRETSRLLRRESKELNEESKRLRRIGSPLDTSLTAF